MHSQYYPAGFADMESMSGNLLPIVGVILAIAGWSELRLAASR